MSPGSWWATVMVPWALESTAVALLLLAVLRLGRSWSPAYRVALSTLGLLKMVVPPALLPTGLWSLGVADGSGRVQPLGTPMAEGLIAKGWLDALAWTHLAGCLVALGFLLWRVGEIARLRGSGSAAGPRVRNAARRVAVRFGTVMPEIRESSGVSAPMVFGIWRPAVLLPPDLASRLSDAQLEALLAHELSHVRGGDLWLGWLRGLARCLWWFNPLGRLLGGHQIDACEERCDDRVMAGRFATAEGYARGLLVAAEREVRWRPSAPIVATSSWGLESRLRRLASARRRHDRRGWIAIMLLAVVAMPSAFLGRAASDWTTEVRFFHNTPLGEPMSSHAGHDHRHRHRH